MTMETLKRWENMSVEEKSAIVRKLAHDGHSANEIAKRINGDVSRNAVIGHARRHGIKLAHSHGRTASPKVAPAKPAAVKKRQVRTPIMAKAEASFQNEPSMAAPTLAPASLPTAGDRRRPFDPLPGVEPLNIVDLPLLGRCRWPVNGDGREALFCGCITVPNTNVYCETHAQFARPKEAAHDKNP